LPAPGISRAAAILGADEQENGFQLYKSAAIIRSSIRTLHVQSLSLASAIHQKAVMSCWDITCFSSMEQRARTLQIQIQDAPAPDLQTGVDPSAKGEEISSRFEALPGCLPGTIVMLSYAVTLSANPRSMLKWTLGSKAQNMFASIESASC